MFLNYHSQLATQYGMELDAYAQAKGYADANAMLADSVAYFEHLAKQDLSFRPLRNSWISPPRRNRSTVPTAPTPTPTAHSAVC